MKTPPALPSLLTAAITATGLLLACGVAVAQDSALQRCRALTEAAPRLACYDAIPLPAAGSAAAANPAAAPRQTPQQFGLEVQQAAKTQLDAIETTISGRFYGWGPGERIELANGQVWQISDDSRGVLDVLNPKVRVRRGALGAFFLEFEGSNRSPKVRRVQ